MGCTVNNFLLRGIIEGVLEGIVSIHDTNGDVVRVINGKNEPQCRCYQDIIVELVKVNSFHLGSTIGTMAWAVAVDIVTDLIDVWG